MQYILELQGDETPERHVVPLYSNASVALCFIFSTWSTNPNC